MFLSFRVSVVVGVSGWLIPRVAYLRKGAKGLRRKVRTWTKREGPSTFGPKKVVLGVKNSVFLGKNCTITWCILHNVLN